MSQRKLKNVIFIVSLQILRELWSGRMNCFTNIYYRKSQPEVSRLWGTFKISVGKVKLTNYVLRSLQSTCFVNIQCFVVLRKEASWGGQTNNQNNKSDYLQVWRAAASHNNHENNPNISPSFPSVWQSHCDYIFLKKKRRL